jgi:NarL family two-component system sensor histidine kinase LiaS
VPVGVRTDGFTEARSSRCRPVSVPLARSPSGYQAILSDNGVGFVVAATEGSSHYGLKGMKERVQKLGGTLDIASAPGKGTKIEIAIPFPTI